MKKIRIILGAMIVAMVMGGCGDKQKNKLLQKGVNAFYGSEGTELDREEAFRLFSEAAEAGNARAMYYQGLYYSEHNKVSDEIDTYEKAVEMNDDLARLGLGMRYINGNGLVPDYEKARILFESAIENGCIEANYGMGILYRDDCYGVAQNTDEALKYFSEAANGEDPYWTAKAYGRLSDIYRSGTGVEADLEKALEYENKANEIAENWTANYLLGIGKIYKDMNEEDKAEDYYNRALAFNTALAESGDSSACNAIGDLYYSDDIKDPDYEKALEWYRKAADAGHATAMNNIGFLYGKGHDVEQNYEKAMEWYQKAADAGDASAMYNIGCLYQKGQGVDQDYQKAFEYYEKAAEMGDEMAVSRIRDLVNNGCISRDEAEKWMD